MLMSVRKGLQNATPMPLVLTMMDLTTVAVSMDTLEMDGTAQVWCIIKKDVHAFPSIFFHRDQPV